MCKNHQDLHNDPEDAKTWLFSHEQHVKYHAIMYLSMICLTDISSMMEAIFAIEEDGKDTYINKQKYYDLRISTYSKIMDSWESWVCAGFVRLQVK